MSEDEWELIRRCRDGSTEAFGPLVRRHQGSALAYAAALLDDPADAEDAVQDAFVRAYRSLDGLEPGSAFGGWFRTILRNECLDRLRSARRWRERSWPEEGPEPASRSADGPARMERRELAGEIRSALAALDPAHRAVLVLRELDGLSYAEIARELEISEGTVASRLHHGRSRLKGILTQRGITPEEIIR